jgi:hypothetical protein
MAVNPRILPSSLIAEGKLLSHNNEEGRMKKEE